MKLIGDVTSQSFVPVPELSLVRLGESSVTHSKPLALIIQCGSTGTRVFVAPSPQKEGESEGLRVGDSGLDVV